MPGAVTRQDREGLLGLAQGRERASQIARGGREVGVEFVRTAEVRMATSSRLRHL